MSFDPNKLAAIDPTEIYTVEEAARALGYQHGQSVKYHYYTSRKLEGTLKGHVLIFSGAQLLRLVASLQATAPRPLRAGKDIPGDVGERYEMALRLKDTMTLREIASAMGYATPSGVSRLLRRGIKRRGPSGKNGRRPHR